MTRSVLGESWLGRERGGEGGIGGRREGESVSGERVTGMDRETGDRDWAGRSP